MNKSELVDAVAEATDLSRAAAGRVVEAMLSAIERSLKNGNPVSIAGFGVFSIRDRAARTARNPRTGETVAVLASRLPVFKAGKALKDAVN